MTDEAPVPALPEPSTALETTEKRPTTRAGRAAAVKPWKTSKRLKRNFRKFLSSKELYESIRAIISDNKHPHFIRTLEILLKYGEIPVVDPIADEGEDDTPLQPTALPPVVHMKETVREIFAESGELLKVFGKKQKPDVQDAEYTIEE